MRSQEKNLNQNRDSNLGTPDFQPGSGSNFSLEILECKFPKAQIMSLFSINNFI